MGWDEVAFEEPAYLHLPLLSSINIKKKIKKRDKIIYAIYKKTSTILYIRIQKLTFTINSSNKLYSILGIKHEMSNPKNAHSTTSLRTISSLIF
jgi:hypothetical protein